MNTGPEKLGVYASKVLKRKRENRGKRTLTHTRLGFKGLVFAFWNLKSCGI